MLVPQHGCGGSEDNFVKWGPLLLSLGWFWGSNSGCQVCVASALPTEPALEIGSDVSSECGCLEKHVEGRIPLWGFLIPAEVTEWEEGAGLQ